jgi:hypothetical protein
MRILIFLLIVCVAFVYSAPAQTIPAGTPLLEEVLRRKQLLENTDSTISFTISPIFQSGEDSFYQRHFGLPASKTLAKNNFFSLASSPLIFTQQFNSHHPYSRNDGSMIPAKGYQAQLSAGAFIKVGLLSFQLQPELVFAQNAAFTPYASNWSDTIWSSYYGTVLNRIDQPERFGNKTYVRLFPGQSSIRLNHKRLSIGISTENLWWGPGIRNALIMTNNAPGFIHLTFNTTAPVTTPVGSFEWQVISGRLKSSGILPDTTRMFDGKPLYEKRQDEDRYVNGAVFCWQPKWTKGFYLGFARLFYLYESDVRPSVSGYLPIVAALYKPESSNEDHLKRDQILSLYFRLILPKENAELYGEFGRNDHSGDTRDLLLEPEHSRAFIIGFQKIFPIKNTAAFELMMECTNLGATRTSLLRAQPSWYVHHQVQDGYTNNGQVIGAAIGPGANSQTVGFNWLTKGRVSGFRFERVTHNNDFYYNAFTPLQDFMGHWIDLSYDIHSGWTHKRLFYRANLSYTNSLNYYWEQNKDVHNVSVSVSAGYIF